MSEPMMDDTHDEQSDSEHEAPFLLPYTREAVLFFWYLEMARVFRRMSYKLPVAILANGVTVQRLQTLTWATSTRGQSIRLKKPDNSAYALSVAHMPTGLLVPVKVDSTLEDDVTRITCVDGEVSDIHLLYLSDLQRMAGVLAEEE